MAATCPSLNSLNYLSDTNIDVGYACTSMYRSPTNIENGEKIQYSLTLDKSKLKHN